MNDDDDGKRDITKSYKPKLMPLPAYKSYIHPKGKLKYDSRRLMYFYDDEDDDENIYWYNKIKNKEKISVLILTMTISVIILKCYFQ